MIDLRSAPPKRDLPAATRNSIRSELVRRVSDDVPDRPPADRRPSHGPRRRRLGIASLAAASLVAVVLLALPVVVPLGTPASIDPVTASLLHRFSADALRTPSEPAPGPGQYVYERTQETTLVAFSSPEFGASFRYYLSSNERSWLGTDGSGRSEWHMSEPTFFSGADRELYDQYIATGLAEQEHFGFEFGESGTKNYGPGELTFFDFSDLPTDVDVLKQMIERREIIGGPEGDWETFNLSADILTWSYAPPELRAALFEVMATLPGVSASGPTQDALDRAGIVIGYTHEDQRQEIVFDRRTGQILERRWVSVTGDPEAPDPANGCEGPPGACGPSTGVIGGPPGTMSSVITYGVYGAVVEDAGDVPQDGRQI